MGFYWDTESDFYPIRCQIFKSFTPICLMISWDLKDEIEIM